ncbi:MATE family efflux transporter [Defluviimonas sp. D31]|uniref:MATE family efflux transporter n=1 Tax=Defluviimonas sp. D31 TaxID=3083253 RepID=UPI00296F3670|nr:MATE family efflux transporter [Defluviimonas sp. D31]MDW4550508.1 MATE family efflux transporter [Defluviimonas sp. D31]
MTGRGTFGAHGRALIALGLPLVGSNLAQMALHVTDTVMMGWYGVTELAAVVLGASSFFILFILGAGFAQAVMPMVAAALGRGDETQVRRDTRMGLWLSALFGIAVLPVMWWSGPILRALGQNDTVAALAQDYLRIAGLGMIPALLVAALRSFLSALERAGIVLWATVAGVVLNAGLNWMFIFGNWGAPELGIRGAAIASVGTQTLTLVVMGVYAAAHPATRRFQLLQRFWRPDWPAFVQVYRLGWPIGLTGLFEGGLFVAASLMMGWIGTMELAAHGIAQEIAAVTFMVHLGLSNAATVRAGRALGRDDGPGLRDGALAAIAMSLVFASLVVVLFLALPEPLIRAFLDPSEPQAGAIVAYATALLAVAALFQLADAAQVMALGLLRGVQDTRVPMLIASVSYWLIGIPASYVLAFPLGLGGVGLWLGLVVGLAVAAALLMARFWRRWGGRPTAAA